MCIISWQQMSPMILQEQLDIFYMNEEIAERILDQLVIRAEFYQIFLINDRRELTEHMHQYHTFIFSINRA